MRPNHFCMQCTDRTSGKVGDFAYHTDNPFGALSPVFVNLIGLLDWLKTQGLKMGNQFELIPV